MKNSALNSLVSCSRRYVFTRARAPARAPSAVNHLCLPVFGGGTIEKKSRIRGAQRDAEAEGRGKSGGKIINALEAFRE